MAGGRAAFLLFGFELGFLGFCWGESFWPLPFAPVTLTLALSRRAGEGICS